MKFIIVQSISLQNTLWYIITCSVIKQEQTPNAAAQGVYSS